MFEIPYQVTEDGCIVFVTVLLGNENLMIGAVPAAGPIFVGPAETKWKIRFPGLQHPLKRHLQ